MQKQNIKYKITFSFEIIIKIIVIKINMYYKYQKENFKKDAIYY